MTETALTASLPSAVDEAAYVVARNAQLHARLVYARAHRGYVTVYLGGEKVHAAVSTMRGYGGHEHPRAFCQPHTPRSYGGEDDPLGVEREVTCLRCLAGMHKRGIRP